MPTDLPPSSLAPEPASPRVQKPPRHRLGNYWLLREIGRGGMGIVYEAEHHTLGRRVALKVLPAVAAVQPERLARFQREARAASRLHHSHIVPVFEVGEEDGLYFYAMQYIPGQSLDLTLRQLRTKAQPEGAVGEAPTGEAGSQPTQPLVPGSLSPAVSAIASPIDLPDPRSAGYYAWAAELVRQAAAAVDHAHCQGVLHRDLKPANLLLSAPSHLWVTDFGLARIEDEESTRTGAVLGTLRYAAPEQLNGQTTARSDIHSLGLTLYELLTLRPAFDASNQIVLLAQVRQGEPIRPRALRPDIPLDLETIVLRAIDREPARRYKSADDLADDLGRFLADKPIRARRTGPVEHVVRWARRQPALAALLLTLAGVLMTSFAGISIALGSALSGWEQASKHAARADAEAADAKAAHQLAEDNLYGSRLARTLLEWRVHRMAHARQELDACPPAGRGWEWRYLDSLLHADLRTIEEPDNPMVYRVAFSPGGERLAVAAGNPFARDPTAKPATVKVWDLSKEQPCLAFTPTPVALAVAFSPDGRFLASNAYPPERDPPSDLAGPGMVRVWDSRTGKEVRTLPGPFDRLYDLDFSPDGKRLAVAVAAKDTSKAGARVIDLTTGEDVLPPLRTGDQVRHVAFSRDGKHLAYGGLGDHVLIHDVTSGKEVARLHCPDEIGGLHFGPRNRLAISNGFRVGLWEFVGGGEVGVRPALQFTCPVKVLKVAISPDGRFVAGGCADSSVRLWDTELGKETLVLRGHRGRVATVSFHPSGRYLASGGQQPGEVKIWDLTRHPEYQSLPQDGTPDDLEALAFSADGKDVLTVSRGGELRTREVASDRTRAVQEIDLHGRWMVPTRRASLSATSGRLVTCGDADPRVVKVYETASGWLTHALAGHPLEVTKVAISRDETHIAASSLRCDKTKGEAQRALSVWNLADGKRVPIEFRFAASRRGYGALALNPTGSLLAFDRPGDGASKPACRIRIVQSSSGEQVAELATGLARCSCLAFSPDGERLAAVGEAGELWLWDTGTWRPMRERPLRGPAGIEELAWSPDSQRLAGVSRDLVQIWNVESGLAVLELKGAPDRFWDSGFNPQVAWSPDGAKLAVTNHDHTVSVWDSTDTGSPEGKAKSWQASRDRAYPWHLRQARQQLADGTPFALEFHHEQLARAQPPTPRLRLEWADLLARRQRWKEAAAEQERATREDAALATADELRRTVLLRHAAGEPDRARAAGKQLVALWEKSKGQRATAALCRVCIRDTAFLGEPGALLEHIQAEARQRPKDRAFPFYAGVILFRTGRYEDAAASLRRSLELGGPDEWKVFDWLLLALACERLGDRGEALAWRGKAESWYEKTKAVPAKWREVILYHGWESHAELMHLREEARAALGQK